MSIQTQKNLNQIQSKLESKLNDLISQKVKDGSRKLMRSQTLAVQNESSKVMPEIKKKKKKRDDKPNIDQNFILPDSIQKRIQALEQKLADIKPRPFTPILDSKLTDAKMDLFELIDQNRNSISELQKNHPPPLEQVLTNVRGIVKQILQQNNNYIQNSLKQKQQQSRKIQKQIQQKLTEVQSLFSADIKRIRRQISEIKSQSQQDPIFRSGIGQQGSEQHPDHLHSNAKKKLQKQISHLWTFMQQYMDENSLDKVKKIQKSKIQRLNTSKDLTRVMNQLQWIARYSQFISPDCIQNFILSVKDMYNRSSDRELCNRYTNGTHQSVGVLTTLRLLTNAQISMMMKSDSNKENLVVVLLQVMQPLLVNNYNLQKCKSSKTSITSLFIRLIKRHQLHKLAQKKKLFEQAPKDLKFTMRCMASCLRDQEILQQLIKSSGEMVIQLLLSILIVIEDEQILANTAKCIGMFLMNEICFQILSSSQHASAICNVLLDCVQRLFESNVIIKQSVQALQVFVSKVQNVRLVDPQKVRSLVRVMQAKDDQKVRKKSKTILKICIDSIPEIFEQIRSMGCLDLINE